MFTKFWSEILNDSDKMVDLGAQRRITLRRILIKLVKRCRKDSSGS
jgi:hypothetical protein